MYQAYKTIDAGYANTCLQVAKKHYTAGSTNPSTGQHVTYYTHFTNYEDELGLASALLYKSTNVASYLTESKTFATKFQWWHPYAGDYTNVSQILYLELYDITGQNSYKTAISDQITAWYNSINSSSCGRLFHSDWKWGSLQYGTGSDLLVSPIQCNYKCRIHSQFLFSCKENGRFCTGNSPEFRNRCSAKFFFFSGL
ncbi:MAG: endoglucanase [Saprospiraceae bacterium]|jgi:endoglucanase